MNVEALRRSDDTIVRRYEYGGTTVVAADLGPDANEAEVDVVGDTVIVVRGDDTVELDVDGDPEAFISNGVLTVEVRA
jgi:hypothetical protein